jgi:hypothetical protein
MPAGADEQNDGDEEMGEEQEQQADRDVLM